MKKHLLIILTSFLLSPAFSQNTWVQQADVGGASRFSGVGFSIDSIGYIGSGYDGSLNLLGDFWQFDDQLNSWTQIADIPVARFNAFSFVLNNKAYVGTGSTGVGGGDINSVYEYDPVLNAWVQKANFPVSCNNALGMALDGAGYVYEYNSPNNFYKYSVANDSWSNVSSFPGSARDAASVFTIRKDGYLMTGWLGGAPYREVWKYDSQNDIWNQKNNFPGAGRWDAIGFSTDSSGYLGLGYDSSSTEVKDFWEYNPLSDSWRQISSFPGTSGDKAVGFTIGKYIYVGAGSLMTDFWKFYSDYTGINEIENISINAFPNPAHNKLLINCLNKKEISLIIYNTHGESLLEKAIIDKEEIDLSKFQPGMYYFNFQNGKNRVIKKIVVN